IGDDSRARIGNERAGRRVAAGGQLRAPDGCLRLRLAGEPPKQLGAYGSVLRIGAGAIEIRGTLLLDPRLERIHALTASTATIASMRARTSGVSFATMSSARMF